MTEVKMTIHQALAELKVLESRVNSAINNGIYCQVNIEKNNVIEGMKVKDYEDTIIRASYDKSNDLLKRIWAIKTAVNQSNAVKEIEVAGKKYTVATAIWMKQYGIDMKKALLSNMKAQYSVCRRKADKHNETRAEKAEKYVLEMYGNKEGKVDAKAIEEDKNRHIEMNTMKILDPIDINKKIEELEAEIDGFMSEIDAALSVSNALTTIEFSY